MTGAGRLPDVIIAGVPKAGTSALWAHLSKHPAIFVPEMKEVDFFTRHWEKGPQWYRDQFAGAAPNQVALEATPAYVPYPPARRRMARTVPHARLIVCLRHPVDRAHSHYWFQQGRFPANHTFEEVVDCELSTGEPPDGYFHFVRIGQYAEHLRDLSTDYPEDRVHIVLADDLRADEAAQVDAMLAFAGVEPMDLGPIEHVNDGFHMRSQRLRRYMLRHRTLSRFPRSTTLVDRLNRAPGYPTMKPAIRARLLRHYEPHNRDLEELLGRTLPERWYT